jgi:hypothetical protein
MAVRLLKEQNAKRFAELFTKGVPSLKVTDVTSDEVIVLKLDHVDQQGLTDPHELQRSANMLFTINKTESDVATQLATLIDKIAPMKQKARVELDSLRAKLEHVKASGNSASVELTSREIRDFIFAYRRGFVQNLHNTFRCPSCFMSALFKKATGHNPTGINEYLPTLTSADVTSLWNSHKADLEIRENGVPKYNKERVGPNFSEKWTKLVEKSKQAEADGTEKEPKAKAMSAKDMMQEVKEGKYKSELACRLTSHHAGDKTVDNLESLDCASYYSDLVRKHDAGMWEKVVIAAKEIEKRLIAADKAKQETSK